MTPHAHRKEYFRVCSKPDCCICRPVPKPAPEHNMPLLGLAICLAIIAIAGLLAAVLP